METKTKISKICIVDDHKLFREGLKFVIAQMDQLQVVAEASNGREFLEIIDGDAEIDLVLMDISMPEINGVEATSQAIAKRPGLKILVLSMYGDEEYYYQMIHAGAMGFVLKQSGMTELEAAINAVLHGENYFSQKLLRDIICNINGPKAPGEAQKSQEMALTKRELEILELICHGLSNAQIAERLYLSIRTVEGHKSNIISKTGVKNTIGLMMYALKNKLIHLPDY